MARLEWDQVGQKLYEAGVEQGVLYPQDSKGTYPLGVAWNGLTNVTQSPSGAEPESIWADNRKYLTMLSNEEFGGSIEAYTYPDEFSECDGSKEIAPGVYAGQQNRKTFGFAYKTLIGNDVENTKYGYKLHLVYGALVSPSEKPYNSVNDTPEAMSLSWDFSTTPVEIATLIDGEKLKPTSHLEFNSTKIGPDKMKELENILFGTEDAEPRLPLPDEIITLMTDVAA